MKKIIVLLMISFTIVTATTIHDIQSGAVEEEESYLIQGIVTAANGETAEGDTSFYIQDGEGAYNGINVISSEYTVSRGDLIEVYGEYIEFYGRSEIRYPDNLEILSSGNELPEPETLTLNQADWEPWEGVLIRIESVVVSNDDAEYGEWDVSDFGGANTMRIDNAGNYTYSPDNGDQFVSITGPLNYTFSEYKIIPRDDEDIVEAVTPVISNIIYSPSSPTEEDDITVSANITDNGSIASAALYYNAGSGEIEINMTNDNGDSYQGTIPTHIQGTQVVFSILAIDNEGYYTQSSEMGYLVLPAGTELVDIFDIQYTDEPSGNSLLEGSPVIINGIVTAEFWGSDNTRIFVQDDEGPWNGIMVYEPTGWNNVDIQSPDGIIHSIAEGDNVNIIGIVSEVNGMTQITNVTSVAISPSSIEIAPSVVTPEQIMTGGTEAEAYEGCLVMIEDVVVYEEDIGSDEWEITDGAFEVVVGSSWEYYYWPREDAEIRSITGCLDYSNGNTKIQPRLARDIVEDGATRIQRVQQVLYSDLLKTPEDAVSDKSYLEGDTLTLEGIVTMPTGLSYAGDGVKFIFEDINGGPWSAILSYDEDSLAFLLSEGDKIQATGYIAEYTTGESNMTELFITETISEPISGELPPISDVSTGDLRWPTTAEQWGNVMVRVDTTIVTGNDFQYEVFAVDDGSGSVLVDDDSDSIDVYFDQVGPPPVGTSIESIRGWVYHHYGYYSDSTTYKLEPLYVADIVFGAGPPSIPKSSVMRDPCVPGPGDEVFVTCNINDNSSVISAEIIYSVNDENSQSVGMINTGGTSWSGTIPATGSDGVKVNYYIQAVDDGVDQDGIETGTYPFDSSLDQLGYITRDGDLFISDIQYTDWSAGNSPFDGCEVSITGIVTAGDEVYVTSGIYAIQSESSPWNGIIFDGWEDAEFTLGDEVTVTGTIEEYDPEWHFKWDNNTKLINVESSTLNSTENSVLPITVNTANLSQESNIVESYEGCLVTVTNVTVNNLNEFDWSVIDDFGDECLIDNDWADSDANVFFGGLQQGTMIESVTGIFNFSFGTYKIQVRNMDDIIEGQVGIDEDFITQPYTFALYSNYPNPFNPETRLRFEVGAHTDVKLIIYDLLGRQVRSLVEGSYTPGRHVVNWDGRDDFGSLVSTGIYIYRFRAGDFVDHKKMILIR